MNTNAATPLQGQWGGEQSRLSIDANGGRIELDCASGSWAGPLQPGQDGKFSARGAFEQHRPGPQQADAAAAPPAATYSGEVKNGVMTLRILPDGATNAQVFTLREGARTKLHRCL